MMCFCLFFFSFLNLLDIGVKTTKLRTLSGPGMSQIRWLGANLRVSRGRQYGRENRDFSYGNLEYSSC